MKIKTWDIDKQKKLDFQYTEDLSHLVKRNKQITQISPVEVNGSAYKLADIYTIKGKVSSKLKLQCSRCLTIYDFNFENELEEVFLPQEIETNVETDDENVHLLDSEEIDLTSIVEETVALSISYVPLCSEDCKGLCQTCGTNLNEDSCDCNNEKFDPRLADLADWFDKSE